MQYATAKIGAILVNVNPAYRTHELEYVLNQAGISAARRRPSRSRPATTAAMVDEVARRVPDARARRLPRDGRLGRPARRRRRASRRASCARGAGDPLARRPDQHPVHLRHHRLPQGRDAEPPQHPQQRLLRRRAVPLHRGRPGLHPGALLPLLRHGHGQPRVHHPRRLHGHPGARLRPGRDPARRSADERCTSLYGVPTMFIAEWRCRTSPTYDLSTVRTGIMAGSPCPAEMMKKLIAAGHRRDDDLLRHDRDVAGLDADPHRRHLRAKVGTVGRVGPHLEIKVVDPPTGETAAARRGRASSAPRATR